MNDVLTSASDVLSANPAHWASLAQTIPADLLSQPPAPGEWSALECLQHLIDTEPVFQFRVDAFLAGRDFPAFDPDTQGTKPEAGRAPADLAAEYARLRAASLDALARLTPGDLDPIQVLAFDGDLLADITTFGDPALFSHFGLPLEWQP